MTGRWVRGGPSCRVGEQPGPGNGTVPWFWRSRGCFVATIVRGSARVLLDLGLLRVAAWVLCRHCLPCPAAAAAAAGPVRNDYSRQRAADGHWSGSSNGCSRARLAGPGPGRVEGGGWEGDGVSPALLVDGGCRSRRPGRRWEQTLICFTPPIAQGVPRCAPGPAGGRTRRGKSRQEAGAVGGAGSGW